MKVEASPSTSCTAPDGVDSNPGDPDQTVSAMEQTDQNDDEGSDNTTISLKKKPQCQVEHCTAILASEKAYCIKRRLCNEHMRADAVSCRGQSGLWRFCFQCGKLEPLSRFEGNKRSCRTRLAQRKQRETRRCHSDINYRYTRTNTRLPPIGPGSKHSKASGRHHQAAAQLHGFLQDMQEELHVCLQHPDDDSVHPAAISAASPPPVSPFQQQQQQQQQPQYSCPLPVVCVKDNEFPGFAATPRSGTAAAEALAGFSGSSSIQYSMQYSQQRSPTPSLPTVPEGEVHADVYTPTVSQQQQQQQEATAQQAAAAMPPRHGARRVSFAPAAAAAAAAAQHAADLPWFGNSSSSSMVLPQMPAASGMAGGCQSAPLPAVSGVSGLSARAATSAQRAASPSPAVGGGEVQSAEAASYYSKLLDDLLMEVRSDACVPPAAGQGLMHLDSLPGDDLLLQHTDSDLRVMLETALEQAAVVTAPPTLQPQPQQQRQQQQDQTAAGQNLPINPGRGPQDQQLLLQQQKQQQQQQQQVVPLAPTAGTSSFAITHTKLEADNHMLLQDHNMHSSGSLSQAWIASHSSSTLVQGLQPTEHCGTASATLGSFNMNPHLNRPAARVGGGFAGPAMSAPSGAAAATPLRQQQQIGMLTSNSEKLQRIRQQQLVLQQMRSQVTIAHAIAADRNVSSGVVTNGINNLSAAPVAKLQPQTLDQQLSDMQEVINFLQMEMMDLDQSAGMCC